MIKRTADLVTAIMALVLASPVLAVAAIAIRLEDGGPVLFKQQRVGLNGTLFSAFKLRSMVADAERKGLGLAVKDGDERITRVGRLIRATSIDELPQLWNVIRGEMSVVGPRPTVPSQVEQYTPRQRKRLNALPGITGWAQVNGRNSISWAERIELDIWYVEHWSLWLDVKILALTPRALLPRGGSHYGAGGTTPAFVKEKNS